MGGVFGVKATEEVLNLAKVITLAIIAEAQNKGWKWADLPAFLKSPDLEAALKPVVADWNQVLPEVSELDLWDDLALGRTVYTAVQEIVSGIKAVAAK